MSSIRFSKCDAEELAMTAPTTIALTPKDRFMQIARQEMAMFEKSESQLRKTIQIERAKELSLPIHLDPIR